MYEFFNPLGVRLATLPSDGMHVLVAGADLYQEGLHALFQAAATCDHILHHVDWVEVSGIAVGVKDLLEYANCDDILTLVSQAIIPPSNN